MTASSTVRGHLRGLQVLQALNRRNYSTALQLSRDTGLARATVYRLLATLVEAGFVEQPGGGEHYCVHSSVLSLSQAFDARADAVEAARPFVDSFSAEVGWPAYVHVYESGAMVPLHVARSPRELSYPRLGARVPVLESSPGRAFLAALDEPERHVLLKALVTEDGKRGGRVGDLHQAEQLVHDAQCYGCGFRNGGWVPRTCSLAVPIRVGGRPVAFMTVMVMRAAMSLNKSIDTYLLSARATAEQIEQEISRRHAAMQPQ